MLRRRPPLTVAGFAPSDQCVHAPARLALADRLLV